MFLFKGVSFGECASLCFNSLVPSCHGFIVVAASSSSCKFGSINFSVPKLPDGTAGPYEIFFRGGKCMATFAVLCIKIIIGFSAQAVSGFLNINQ